MAVVEHRAVEEYEGQRDLATVTRQERQRSGKATAGAEPVEADALLVDTECCGVFVGPAQRLVAIVERPRIRRLWREAVLDGHADNPETGAPPVQQGAVHVVGADHIAAPVNRDDGGQESLRIFGAVHPHGNGRVTRDLVFGPPDRVGEVRRGEGGRSHGGHTGGVDGRQFERVEHRPQFRIEQMLDVQGALMTAILLPHGWPPPGHRRQGHRCH